MALHADQPAPWCGAWGPKLQLIQLVPQCCCCCWVVGAIHQQRLACKQAMVEPPRPAGLLQPLLDRCCMDGPAKGRQRFSRARCHSSIDPLQIPPQAELGSALFQGR